MPRRGRPKSLHPRAAVTLWMDQCAIGRWQRRGDGWRRQMTERLEAEVGPLECGSRVAGRTLDGGDAKPPAAMVQSAAYTLMKGNCRSIALPPFDALITDPPYGMHYVSRHRAGRDGTTTWGRHVHGQSFKPIAGDDRPFDPRPWLALAGNRPVCLWGANYYADRLPASGGRLIWDKAEGGAPNTQADAEIAWTNAINKPRLYSHLWRGLCRRGEENLSRGGRKLHPNQKPVALMDWVLDQCGIQPGQTVLDPYMGVASLGVACVRRGIRYVGMEIDAHYFEVARQRLVAESGH